MTFGVVSVGLFPVPEYDNLVCPVCVVNILSYFPFSPKFLSLSVIFSLTFVSFVIILDGDFNYLKAEKGTGVFSFPSFKEYLTY